jgi:hypothetical protein
LLASKRATVLPSGEAASDGTTATASPLAETGICSGVSSLRPCPARRFEALVEGLDQMALGDWPGVRRKTRKYSGLAIPFRADSTVRSDV